MFLTIIYLGISLFFTYGTYASLPRNGCYRVAEKGLETQSIICADFQSFELITIFYFFVALLFAVLGFLRAFKKVNLINLNSGDAKNLADHDF